MEHPFQPRSQDEAKVKFQTAPLNLSIFASNKSHLKESFEILQREHFQYNNIHTINLPIEPKQAAYSMFQKSLLHDEIQIYCNKSIMPRMHMLTPVLNPYYLYRCQNFQILSIINLTARALQLNSLLENIQANISIRLANSNHREHSKDSLQQSNNTDFHGNSFPNSAHRIPNGPYQLRGSWPYPLRKENGKYVYECNVCLKRFKQLGNLKVHLNLHTGIKPYKCEVCQRDFTQLAHLKQHFLIHTGEKPHKCQVCNKQFRYTSNLKEHAKQHRK